MPFQAQLMTLRGAIYKVEEKTKRQEKYSILKYLKCCHVKERLDRFKGPRNKTKTDA